MTYPRAGDTYRPPEYWSVLHETAESLGIVGYPTLPLVFNRYVYANAALGVLRGLAASGVSIRDRAVLDVGSGTGFWIDLWLREGAASVAGVDLVPGAVERLHERFPGAELAAVDITEQAPFPDEHFDVVTVMSVLHHVVDEERFDRALANLASALAADGYLAALDALVVRGRWMPSSAESAHNVARTLSRWESGASRAGLRIVSVIPTTTLLGDPVDAGSRVAFSIHRLLWRGLSSTLRGRDRLASVVVPPVAALDRALTPRLRHGSSAKLIILQRT